MAGVALTNKTEKEQELDRYFQPEHPGAFSGFDKFRRALPRDKKVTTKEIKDFLKSKDAYTYHFPVRYRFDRSRVVVASVNQLWDLDLLFMLEFSQHNDQWKYILTCVDVLSHYAFCERLKTKNSAEVTSAFNKILIRAEQQSRLPRSVRTDGGAEFTGKNFRKAMSLRGIKHFVTLNVDTKANYAER